MKRFVSLLLVLTVLFSMFVFNVPSFAAQELTDPIYAEYEQYLRYRTYQESITHTYPYEDGVNVTETFDMPFTISYYSNGNSTKNTPVIIYVIGTAMPRIGTESDISILNDYILGNTTNEEKIDDAGCVVAVIDFHNNPEAQGVKLSYETHAIVANMIRNGGFGITSVPSNYTKRHYMLPAGYRVATDIEYYDLVEHGINGTDEFIAWVWNRYWAGKRVISNGNKMSIEAYEEALAKNPSLADVSYYCQPVTSAKEIMQKDGVTPIDVKLRLDISYPSNPKEVVPVLMHATSSEWRIGSSAKSDFVMPHFMYNGYAVVNYDHELVPMYRNDGKHYSYSLETLNNFSLGYYLSNHTTSAAVRRVRLLKEKYGLSDYMVTWGFSKSSPGPAWMSNATRDLDEEYRDYAYNNGKNDGGGIPFVYKNPDAPDPVQPWLTYEDGTEVSSNVTVTYSGSGPGVLDIQKVTLPNINEGDVAVPLATTVGVYDSTGGFYKKYAGSAQKYLESKNFDSFSLPVDGIGHGYPRGYDETRDEDYWDMTFTYVDNHIRAAYREEPPVVLWTTPKDKSKFDSLSVPVEVKFSRAMDVESVENGVKIIEESTGRNITGTWTTLHGDTRFQFATAGLKKGQRYRIEVTDICKAKDGVHLTEKMVKRFDITGGTVFDATKDAYISSSNPTLNYGNENVISVKNNSVEITKGYIGFERETGFRDVQKAQLVFSGSNTDYSTAIYGLSDHTWNENEITWNNAPANDKEGNGFDTTATKISVVGPNYNAATCVDVTDYIKSLDGNSASFALNAPIKAGKVKEYTFEGMTDDDFVRNTDYRLGGEGISNTLGYHTDFINDEKSIDGTYFAFCNRTKSSARIKFANMFGLENNKLTQDDLGKTYTVTMLLRADSDISVRMGLMSASDGNYATDIYSIEWPIVYGDEWTEYTYRFSVDQTMIDNNTSYLAFEPYSATSSLYIDNLSVTIKSEENQIVSKESTDTSSISPILIITTNDNASNIEGTSTYIESGKNADKNFANETKLYVKGADLRNTKGSQKGYVKIALDNVDTANSVKLAFDIANTANQFISVYGIDAPSDSNMTTAYNVQTREFESSAGWTNEITWNSAVANDKNANGVDLKFAYGNNALATIDCSLSGTKEIDVTSFVKKLKTDGATYATFVFTAEKQSKIRTIDFEDGINTFEAYSPKIYKESKVEYNVVYDSDRKSNVLHFARDAYGDSITIKGFINTNDKWTANDIGKTFKISAWYKTHTGKNSSSRFIAGVANYGAYTGSAFLGSTDTNNNTKWADAQNKGTLLYKHGIKDGAGWQYIENTFTITEDMVKNHSTKTAFLICGYGDTKNIYIDDLKCEEVYDDVIIDTGVNFVNKRDFDDNSLSYITVEGLNGYGLSDDINIGNKKYAKASIAKGTGPDGTDCLVFEKYPTAISEVSYNPYDYRIFIQNLYTESGNTYTSDMVGKTYRMTFDLKTEAGSRTLRFYNNIFSKTNIIAPNTGWNTYSYEYTVLESHVGTKSHLYIGSNGAVQPIYIDNIVIEEITDKKPPRLVLANEDSTTENSAVLYNTVKSSYPDLSFKNELTIKREDYSEKIIGSKKAYLSYNIGDPYWYKNAKLNLNILKNASKDTQTINVYALLETAFDAMNLTFNNAPANNKMSNGVNINDVYNKQPIANVNVKDAGEIIIDVLDYVKTLTSDSKAVFMVTTDDTPNTVVYERDFEDDTRLVLNRDYNLGGQSNQVLTIKTESDGNKYLELSNLKYNYSRIIFKKAFGVGYFTRDDIGTKYKVSFSLKPNADTSILVGAMSTYPSAPNSGGTSLEYNGGVIKYASAPKDVWTDYEFIYTVNESTLSKISNGLSIGDQSSSGNNAPKATTFCIDNIKVEKLDGASIVEIGKNSTLNIEAEEIDETENGAEITDYYSTGDFVKGDSVYVNILVNTAFNKTIENVDFYINGMLVEDVNKINANGSNYVLRMLNLKADTYEVYADVTFSDGETVTTDAVIFEIIDNDVLVEENVINDSYDDGKGVQTSTLRFFANLKTLDLAEAGFNVSTVIDDVTYAWKIALDSVYSKVIVNGKNYITDDGGYILTGAIGDIPQTVLETALFVIKPYAIDFEGNIVELEMQK